MTDTELQSMASPPAAVTAAAAVAPVSAPAAAAAPVAPAAVDAVPADTASTDVEPSVDASVPARSADAPRRPRGGRAASGRGQPQHARAAQGDRPKGAPQRERKVNPVLETLYGLYPLMFGGRFLPLKLGVFQELLALHPEAFKREDLKVALGLHARSMRYLEAVAGGAQRHDLNGVAVEPVAPEHVHHAIFEVFRRRQARSADDLRPHLLGQLMQAIEGSGLSREDYVERIHTQDELAVAVLDEAFAELGAQAAKREALLRAFESSGSTLEQFAEMYGLELADASYALDRARASK